MAARASSTRLRAARAPVSPAKPVPGPRPAESAPPVPEEDPATRNRLVSWLSSSPLAPSFKLYPPHPPTITSEESAQVRGVTVSSGAKAMLLRAGADHFILAVLSATRTVDFKKLTQALNLKTRPQLASVPEVWAITRCFPGAVPPFGSLFNVQTVADLSLDSQASLNFNIGLRSESAQLSLADFLAVEKPTRADFAKSP